MEALAIKGSYESGNSLEDIVGEMHLRMHQLNLLSRKKLIINSTGGKLNQDTIETTISRISHSPLTQRQGT